MDLGHTQLVSIIEDDENKSSETKGQQRSEGGAKPNYLAWSDGSHSVLSSHQHEMVLQSKVSANYYATKNLIYQNVIEREKN